MDTLKNEEADGKILKILKNFKKEIAAEYRSVVIHLIILHNRGDLYELINEFFDGNWISNLTTIFIEISGFNIDGNKFLEEEVPETYNELIENEREIEIWRKNSWECCLQWKLKFVINWIITHDGEKLLLTVKDLLSLYDIGPGLLYKVSVCY